MASFKTSRISHLYCRLFPGLTFVKKMEAFMSKGLTWSSCVQSTDNSLYGLHVHGLAFFIMNIGNKHMQLFFCKSWGQCPKKDTLHFIGL